MHSSLYYSSSEGLPVGKSRAHFLFNASDCAPVDTTPELLVVAQYDAEVTLRRHLAIPQTRDHRYF
jgi:hypothetical protein